MKGIVTKGSSKTMIFADGGTTSSKMEGKCKVIFGLS